MTTLEVTTKQRFEAFILDAVIFSLIGALFAYAYVEAYEAIGNTMRRGLFQNLMYKLYRNNDVFITIAQMAGWVSFTAIKGATPGKMIKGYKVVRLDGSKAGFLAICFRELVFKFFTIVIYFFRDKSKPLIHDRLVKTKVINTK
mgnify:CR=1 FL=1